MKHMLEAFGSGVAKPYLGSLAIIVSFFPAIFVCAIWALLGYVLGSIIDSLELSGALGVYAVVGMFVIGFGVALFFSVYVWPRVSDVISKVLDQLGEAAKSLG